MKKSKAIYISCSFLCLGTTSLYSQSGIVTTGGDGSGTEGSVSYSVGQINYSSINGSSGSVSNGLQHPYEISVVSGVEVIGVNLKLSVYPNPAVESITLKIDCFEFENLTYQLYDMQGKILRQSTLDKHENIITMAELNTSTYFIKILKNDEPIKVFKIIKK